MSLAEPGSLESTASVPPTGNAFIPRMSSIKGPGQKLPRASISLSMVISFSSGMMLYSLSSLNEQSEAALFGALDEDGNACNLRHNWLKISQHLALLRQRGIVRAERI